MQPGGLTRGRMEPVRLHLAGPLYHSFARSLPPLKLEGTKGEATERSR